MPEELTLRGAKAWMPRKNAAFRYTQGSRRRLELTIWAERIKAPCQFRTAWLGCALWGILPEGG